MSNKLSYTLNSLLIIIILFFVFIAPLNTNSFDNSYIQKLKIYFGSINIIKAPIIILCTTVISMLTTFLYTNTLNFKKTMTTIYVMIYIIMYVTISFNITKNCGLDLCWYSNPKSENLTEKDTVNFFAIGDIQNNHNATAGGDGWGKRIKGTGIYIKAVNELSDKFKNNNTTNFNLSDLKDEDKEIFSKVFNNKIIGLINPGDCVQFGSADGRLHKDNSIGAYEYAFNNNPEDGGLLNIPSYECLGNHDHDLDVNIAEKILYLDGRNPMVDMQKRRNKYRRHIVNKDGYGNYSCDWGKLHMIFINIWPSDEKLLTGDPAGSLDFLKRDLRIHGHKKWMIVTHYIPIIDDFSQNYTAWDIKDKPALSKFGEIYEQYKETSLGGLCGHEHRLSGKYKTTPNGFKHHILPGPAEFSTSPTNIIEVPLFSFNQKTQENVLFTIFAEEGKEYKVSRVY